MPDIVGLNFGLVKSTPDLTDLLPIQSIDGITHPTPISGVVAATIASTGFTTKVNQLIGSGSGGIADGDKGDITVSGSGAVWSIDANAVTLAKMTPIATSRLLGRASAGSGSVEAITIGNGLTLTGTTLSSTAVSGGSGGLSPWITKTANYTAIAGDRLRIDATAGDVVISLPVSPTATDSDIWLQRLDTSANKVLIRSGGNKLNAQTAKDGVFAPSVVQLIERLSYVDATIGWLGQYDRLSYQNAPAASGSDPLFANVVLLMPMTTTSGITDIKGKIATNQGATQSTAILDPFGNNAGVMYFPGGGARISIAQSADFAFGSGAEAIDGWFYPTAIPGGIVWGLMDTRMQLARSDWRIAGESTGRIGFSDFSYNTAPFNEFGDSPLILNQWNYYCTSRTINTTENHKTWLNGSLIGTATTRNNAITAAGNLIIGDIIDTAPDYSGSFTGYMSNLRITRAYRDGSIVPTASFPIS